MSYLIHFQEVLSCSMNMLFIMIFTFTCITCTCIFTPIYITVYKLNSTRTSCWLSVLQLVSAHRILSAVRTLWPGTFRERWFYFVDEYLAGTFEGLHWSVLIVRVRNRGYLATAIIGLLTSYNSEKEKLLAAMRFRKNWSGCLL